MRRAPEVGGWISIKSPEGYELEMDVSHPHGRLRHRLLPDGEWRKGNVPVDPSLEEIIGPAAVVEGEIGLERRGRARQGNYEQLG